MIQRAGCSLQECECLVGLEESVQSAFVYLFACVLTGLLTVALQQNVCPFLSPLM